jgi:hypothetical protein
MPLINGQKLTLRTHIQANTTVLAFGAGNAQINTKFAATPLDAGDAALIAGWYNLQAAPDFFVWKDLPMEDVLNLITFAAMTPADAVPTTPALTVDVYRARALACQGKQFNLQNLIIGRQTAPMKRANYRTAMQDCLTGIPAGASGALIAANWNGVRDAAKRLVNNLERVFATGTGTQATPGDVVVEGTVTGDEISDIKGLPA